MSEITVGSIVEVVVNDEQLLFPGSTDIFPAGYVYVVLETTVEDGAQYITVETLNLGEKTLPVKGVIWEFALVDLEAQKEALRQLLALSQADVAAGRVYTKEEALAALQATRDE